MTPSDIARRVTDPELSPILHETIFLTFMRESFLVVFVDDGKGPVCAGHGA